MSRHCDSTRLMPISYCYTFPDCELLWPVNHQLNCKLYILQKLDIIIYYQAPKIKFPYGSWRRCPPDTIFPLAFDIYTFFRSFAVSFLLSNYFYKVCLLLASKVRLNILLLDRTTNFDMQLVFVANWRFQDLFSICGLTKFQFSGECIISSFAPTWIVFDISSRQEMETGTFTCFIDVIYDYRITNLRIRIPDLLSCWGNLVAKR